VQEVRSTLSGCAIGRITHNIVGINTFDRLLYTKNNHFKYFYIFWGILFARGGYFVTCLAQYKERLHYSGVYVVAF